MNTEQTQPTAGAMRASVKIRESLERMNPQFRPSQTEWEIWSAQIIDRETQADVAELSGALKDTLEGLAFVIKHLAADKPAALPNRWWNDLNAIETKSRDVLARHANKSA